MHFTGLPLGIVITSCDLERPEYIKLSISTRGTVNFQWNFWKGDVTRIRISA